MNENQRTRIAYIIQKGTTLQKQVQNLQTYIEGPIADPVNAKLRLENITILYKDYIRYNDELISLQSDHPQLDSFYDIEEQYYEVATAVNKLQRVDTNALNVSNITISERHEMPKLADTKLTKFDGSHDSWLTFKNKFVALVHSRSDISNVVKHAHLEDSLTGSALNKISQFPPSEENYQKAWKALTDTYDQKRLLVVEHLDVILDLPFIPKATSESLSNLIDKVNQHLSMLEQLEAKPSEEIIIRILERCLPVVTRSKWEEKLDVNALPTLEDFYKFIRGTIFKLHSLERASLTNQSNNRKRAGEFLDKAQIKTAKSNARSFITSSNISCIKCNDAHRLFQCPVFENLKIPERWDFIRANKLCRNCLSSHPLPCKNNKRCKKCEREHHTLLHSDKKSKPYNKPSQMQGELSQDLKVIKPSESTTSKS